MERISHWSHLGQGILNTHTRVYLSKSKLFNRTISYTDYRIRTVYFHLPSVRSGDHFKTLDRIDPLPILAQLQSTSGAQQRLRIRAWATAAQQTCTCACVHVFDSRLERLAVNPAHAS